MAKKTETVEIKFVGKDTTKTATDSANRNVESVKDSTLAMNAAIAAAAVATVAVVAKAIDAYGRQEQAILQLEQRIKSTGGAAGLSSKQLTSMAAGLQQLTTFGDEAIIEMQSLLLTFTQIAGPEFERSTTAILNVSQAMGVDLKSAALQVGKALNDPVGQMSALTRSGIQFSKEQKELIKTLVETNDIAGAQNVILDELDKQFGGAAEAARQGTGAIKAASNAVGDLWEAIGSKLSPAVVTLAGDIENLAVRLSELISPSEQGQIRDEITKTAETIDALRGQLQRAESAQDGGFFSELFFGDSADAQRIRNEIGTLETRVLELQGKLTAAAGGPITSPTAQAAAPTAQLLTPAGEQAEIEANARMDALRSQYALELEFRTEQENAISTLEAERLERDRKTRIDYAQLSNQDSLNRFNYEAQLRQASADADASANALKVAQQKVMHDELMTGLSNLSTLMNSENRKAFEVGKAASIASTAINTYESATKSYNALASIPYVGPYLGAAAAAAAVVAGLAQIQNIESTTFGGGAKSGAAASYAGIGSAGGAGTAPQIDQPQQTVAGQEPTGPALEIATGGFIGKWLEEEFAPAWEEAQSRGVGLVIT